MDYLYQEMTNLRVSCAHCIPRALNRGGQGGVAKVSSTNVVDLLRMTSKMRYSNGTTFKTNANGLDVL